MNNKQFEIAVIGGGPAGSGTAIRLANGGFNVCLIEKSDFPREVLCGEFLSKEVGEELKKLGLYDSFLMLKPNKINSFKFINKKEIEAEFDFECFGLKRSIFDSFLLQHAKKSGVNVINPAEVKKILKVNGEYSLEVRINNNEKVNINSKIIVAAYGKRNFLDKQLNRHFINEKSGLNGIKFHINKNFLPEFLQDRIEIYSSDGIYCGLNCVSQDEVTLCFLEQRRNYSGSAINHFSNLFEHNKKFSKIFSDEFCPENINMKVYGTGNIYFGMKELVKDEIFMVGDAARVIAPLAGDGIGMALESSEILARILMDGISRNSVISVMSENYKKEWGKRFNKRLMIAGLIQKSVFRNSFREFGVEIINYFPNLLPKLIKLTRG